MTRTLVTAIFLTLFSQTAWTEQIFKDDDWSGSFYADCGLPENTLAWMREDSKRFLRFSIKNGDKGYCSSDRKSRGGAPYWERSELISGSNPKNKNYLFTPHTYQIKLLVRFVEGFTGDRESILQIKQKCNSKGHCPPMFMLRASYDKLFVEALFEGSREKKSWNSRANYRQFAITIKNERGRVFRPSAYYGQWLDIDLTLNVRPKKADLKTEIKTQNDGIHSAFSDAVAINGASRPFVKIGLYRAGTVAFPNDTSTLDYDIIQITKKSE